ncbi:iron complex transport system ATP-binding protein [Rubricella aquisinus]|uniref:Iron complex transport system ATP-binding protein n=1 Tax=Rubricella aquisinus TaxID=2028108 RepID=A0A840WQH7_9RHOB|nr:ABC transporter ATP-binding protein [Rubricella aquisinus]MBB5516303.1 iron complex transport system ATP-binding protein [Rubricella aquisinus]
MSLMSLHNLRVMRDRRAVVNEVSLTMEAGSLTGLIGPNGAGKSTLMQAALGLIPAMGEITLAGHALPDLGREARARQVAYLPQERDIGWPISVELLVSLGRTPHRRGALGPADHTAITAALTEMDLLPFRHRPATDLSGGERARVLIARALAQEAPLLIADEPTAGLDPAHQIGLMETFQRLARAGRGVLVSLHDLSLAARFCDRLIVMQDGRAVADGPPDAVLTAPLLRAVYGIDAHIARDASGLIVTPKGRAT